jgi:hypothetical protein
VTSATSPATRSGVAAYSVDGQAVLVEVGVEVLAGEPVLVEGEEARVLDALVEVVVDLLTGPPVGRGSVA